MKEFYASIFDTNDQRRSPQPSSTLAKSDIYTMYPHEERTITPQLAELFQHSSFPSCEEEMSNTFDRTRGRFWQSIIMLKMCWQNRKRVWRHNQTRKFSVTNLILAALCTRSPSFYKTKASNNSYQSWFKIKKNEVLWWRLESHYLARTDNPVGSLDSDSFTVPFWEDTHSLPLPWYKRFNHIGVFCLYYFQIYMNGFKTMLITGDETN